MCVHPFKFHATSIDLIISVCALPSSPLFISPCFSFLRPSLSLLINAITEIHTQFWWRKKRDCGMQLNILERWVCCPTAWDHIIVPQGCTQLDTYDITQSSSLPALIWAICWCLPPLQCVFSFFFFFFQICISIADVPHVVSGEIMSVKHMVITLNGRLFLFWFIAQFLNRDTKLPE